ncbi:ubiquitin-like-conjugating enzyme ATG10 isoform X2 [Echeneis naucrates]|uniref:Ubiquitin-like-conjugating enzyme ATG10 n=1 Tax=Echeneis naucrates TaxID=173247 RepID=A0A665X4D0_ECHNA|nr:ubiquitin-like-conjugating enzyme ATG10 isoform X2 [Echeneis naucrates]
MSSCVLDKETFRHCCQLLLQLSEQLGDCWCWVPVQDSQDGYLRKTALRLVTIDSRPFGDQAESSSELGPHNSCLSGPDVQQNDQDQSALIGSANGDIIRGDIEDQDNKDNRDGDDGEDRICRMCEGSSQVLQYEYHILFSCSYRAPVLYFRVCTLEGRSLSLEEVWGSIHPNFRLCLQTSPFTMVTQQEHPLLGQAFFMLHPCRTEDFMRPLLQAAQDQNRPVNYVLTWLSMVGPVVGLDVSLKYSTQF